MKVTSAQEKALASCDLSVGITDARIGPALAKKGLVEDINGQFVLTEEGLQLARKLQAHELRPNEEDGRIDIFLKGERIASAPNQSAADKFLQGT